MSAFLSHTVSPLFRTIGLVLGLVACLTVIYLTRTVFVAALLVVGLLVGVTDFLAKLLARTFGHSSKSKPFISSRRA